MLFRSFVYALAGIVSTVGVALGLCFLFDALVKPQYVFNVPFVMLVLVIFGLLWWSTYDVIKKGV